MKIQKNHSVNFIENKVVLNNKMSNVNGFLVIGFNIEHRKLFEIHLRFTTHLYSEKSIIQH